MNNNDKKQLVKQRYSELALNSDMSQTTSCCGTKPALPSNKTFTIMSEDYTHLKGYEKDADLGVGCGMPTEYSKIRLGDTVVDLGSLRWRRSLTCASKEFFYENHIIV